jgi:hypothetical protein
MQIVTNTPYQFVSIKEIMRVRKIKHEETMTMNKTQKALFTLALGAAFFAVGKEKELVYVQPTITEDINFDSKIDLADYDEVITIKRKYAEQVGLPEGIGL